MSPRIGSLCSGYEGLGLAVQAVFGGELTWWSDIDEGAIRIMSSHHPGVPNLGDFTILDWTRVAPVDILTAGFPCQPFSHAGKRKGADDERHLWPYIREAIRVLRPGLVLLENVPGLRSMGADRVLGDMAEDGLHARWISVRASDVGAAHKRERWFRAAYPEGEPWREWYRDAGVAADTGSQHRHQRRLAATSETPRGRSLGEPSGRGGVGTLLPTPGARDFNGSNQSDSDGSAVRPSLEYITDWGKYQAGIRRHELAVGRPAPCPVQPSSKGTPQLAPAFTEWLMMLPEGWVTDPAIWEGLLNARGKPATKAAIRNAQLHALGNGVVPPQAEYAIRTMLSWHLVESLGGA